MATPLLGIPDLGTWTRQEIGYDDAWAAAVLEAASDLVRSAAQHPEWTAQTVPARARQICAHVAARTYLNPDSVSGEGGIGPIGGDRIVEELAKALHLTAAERDELEGMSPSGANGGGGGLWVQPINATPVEEGDVYLADDSGSDWMIPYLAADDLPALG